MKAKEYFEKYFSPIPDLTDPALVNKACVDLMVEMSGEIIKLCEGRHSSSNSAVEGAIKEMNQRFNAVRDMCEKKYGEPILKRNGLKNYWEKQFREEGI